ncbi:MAG: hypothetical protein M1817_000071 [Caeruleum heppii]|nr:MAG: hypothetical protein M1817_000071 [Caeruleum heppii]
MAVKRKRSLPALSSYPSSTTSDGSSISSADHEFALAPVPFGGCPTTVSRDQTTLVFVSSSNGFDAAGGSGVEMPDAHLPSRTRKRFRDNRPDESVVHEHTLNLLYSAQRHPSRSQTPYSPAALSIPPSHLPQPSLHAFWSLPSSRPAHSPIVALESDSLRYSPLCEDCDGQLVSDGLSADGMDLEGRPADDVACGGCGKRVCERCAVVRERRVCLGCAMAS